MKFRNQEIAISLLDRALRSALPLTYASRRVFGPGPGARDMVISTSRLILILEGTLNYTLEGNHFVLKSGTEFLVPSWCRREWVVPEGERCEIIWCEFEDDPMELEKSQLYSRKLLPAQLSREKRAFIELLKDWKRYTQSPPAAQKLCALEMEGQLKALLSRFWPHAQAGLMPQDQELHPIHSEIKNALRYLEEHFAEANVLEKQQALCGLTPNYFRALFKERMTCSPGEYIKRLRMRQARYLLHATDWQLKRIAIEVGYPDNRYFSRTYHAFWGHPPNQERSHSQTTLNS